jgi:hypothetical protein
MGSIRSLVAVSLIVALALAACEAAPTPGPSPTSAFAAKPAIHIDDSWKAANGEWTFTGYVDPGGESTDVILEIGPGPATLRQFDRQLPVVEDLLEAGPLTISTRDIPDIDVICVRFTATNGAGASSSSPLCFPHDLPSFIADVVPPTTTFSAPAFGTVTVIKVLTFTVAWTEADEGSGVASRSLQRQVATFSGGACGAFANDGAASTAASPVAVMGLVDGRCYQWLEKLRDAAGNTSQTTSGTVRVAVGG